MLWRTFVSGRLMSCRGAGEMNLLSDICVHSAVTARSWELRTVKDEHFLFSLLQTDRVLYL